MRPSALRRVAPPSGAAVTVSEKAVLHPVPNGPVSTRRELWVLPHPMPNTPGGLGRSVSLCTKLPEAVSTGSATVPWLGRWPYMLVAGAAIGVPAFADNTDADPAATIVWGGRPSRRRGAA